MDSDLFAVRGTVTVRDSATVLCARRRPVAPTYLAPSDFHASEESSFISADNTGIFGASGRIAFESGWEVLLGQAEVVNFLKSSPDKISLMAYAGEWKVAGGNVDEGESVDAAAARELSEEFLSPLGLSVPDEAILRPFCTKQTRPIRSRSNLMYNYVALETENAWLQSLDIDAVNAGLRERRRVFFKEHVNSHSDAFWSLPKHERAAVTPEVYQLAWVPLHEAVQHALSSMTPGIYVNKFQEEEFAKRNRKRRDPMFITAATLIELEGFPCEDSLVRHCESVDLAALAQEEQWIFTGMTQAEVDAAFQSRVTESPNGTNPSFKNPDRIAKLRQERAQAGKPSRL